MFEEKGDWLRLYRKVLESRVWSDPTVYRVWSWCLLRANWKAGWFMGQKIDAGEFVFGRDTAASETGLSKNTVYRALEKLEKWDCIRRKKHPKFTVVSVCNWGTYQKPFPPEGQSWDADGTLMGRRRDCDGTLMGPIEEGKESKEGKERRRRERAPFTPPAPQEVVDYGRSIDFEINGERFCAYYEQAGWKLANGNPMKNWKAAVVTWKNREEDKKPKPFQQRLPTSEEEAAWTPH